MYVDQGVRRSSNVAKVLQRSHSVLKSRCTLIKLCWNFQNIPVFNCVFWKTLTIGFSKCCFIEKPIKFWFNTIHIFFSIFYISQRNQRVFDEYKHLSNFLQSSQPIQMNTSLLSGIGMIRNFVVIILVVIL